MSAHQDASAVAAELQEAFIERGIPGLSLPQTGRCRAEHTLRVGIAASAPTPPQTAGAAMSAITLFGSRDGLQRAGTHQERKGDTAFCCGRLVPAGAVLLLRSYRAAVEP